MRTASLALSSAVLSVVIGFAHAQDAPPAPETAKPEAAKDKLDAPPKDVEIKAEMRLIEEVAKRRAAMHFLKNDPGARDAILKPLDPTSARNIRSLIESDENFTNLDYHFLEKVRNGENRVLAKLRKDGFQGVEDVLEGVKDKKFPNSAVFADLLYTVEMNFRFALRKSLISDEEFAKDVAARLSAEAARVTGTAGHSIADLATQTWKDVPPDQFPAAWFDISSGPVSYAFGDVPDAPAYPLVDLNTATAEQLLELPNVETEVVDGILEYQKKNGFQGPEELRLVPSIPVHLVAPMQTLCTASHAARPKKWTVMVFLNAANNLEPYGIEDMNEMEKIGSTRDVNVVVELARYKGRTTKAPVNAEYFSNPYTEREQHFYLGLDNEPGTNRYYVLKDDDSVRVRSVLKKRAGITDGGDPKCLADFGKWAVENYPAEHYCLVIWNHGAGWSGVSYDDNSHKGLDLPEVRSALEAITASVKAKNGKAKIDVLDFDACLMATAEVAYELKDTVDFLLASQETEPGDGMPYDDYLAWLTTYPEASPLSFSKAMVDTYVKSYAPRGSQSGGEVVGFSETKSAIHLARMDEFRAAIENVAAKALARPQLLGAVTEEAFGKTRAFGRLVDVQDFLTKLAEHDKKDVELKEAVKAVTDLIGYPTQSYKLVNEVVIKRRSPGNVVWGWNGWKSPPRSLSPFIHDARFGKIPLVGPDDRGNFVARIQFPPMLSDPAGGRPVNVKEINYRFEDEQEKRTLKDFENAFITTDFPTGSVVVAEGHLVSNSRSHGVSLYFPAYCDLDQEYRKLRFAQDSKWVELIEKFPLKKIESPQPIALLGLNHATKADRDELGKIVVKDEFRSKIKNRSFSTLLESDLKSFGLEFDAITDPRPYGEDWLGLIRHWQDKIVVLDNHGGGNQNGGNPFGHLSAGDGGSFSMFGFFGGGANFGPSISGPDGRTVMRFLQGGGHLLLSNPQVTARLWDTPLYRDTLGLRYGWRHDGSMKFTAKGVKSADGETFDIELARKGDAIVTFTGGPGVEPFLVLEENGATIGAKVTRTDLETGKTYRAVVLGFYLTDVKGEANRRALFQATLTFLSRDGGTPPLSAVESAPGAPKPTAEPAPQAPAAGVPGATGTTQLSTDSH